MSVSCNEIDDAIHRLKKDKYRKQLPAMHKVAGGLPDDHPLYADHRIAYKAVPVKPKEECDPIMKDAIARLKDEHEMDRPFNGLPLSASGLSAGADDPLTGILDFSGANSASSVGSASIETSPSFDGLISLDAENIKSFNEI